VARSFFFESFGAALGAAIGFVRVVRADLDRVSEVTVRPESLAHVFDFFRRNSRFAI
jgi:hypothetical protein